MLSGHIGWALAIRLGRSEFEMKAALLSNFASLFLSQSSRKHSSLSTNNIAVRFHLHTAAIVAAEDSIASISMRGFVILIAICALWAVDRLAFESRYSEAIWHEAKHQGQLFNLEVACWVDKINF
jgi:hypothetical protein